MAIGGPGDERAPATAQKPVVASPTAPSADHSPPRPVDDPDALPKHTTSRAALKENGLHNTHTHNAVRHRLNPDRADAPEAGAAPPERTTSPADVNGHPMASTERASQHSAPHSNQPATQQLTQTHLQQQQGIVGLASAFENLTVGAQPSHPSMVHHPHHPHAPLPHHPLAHHPHTHPAQLAGPPHAQPPHPHPHPHLHPPGQQPPQPHLMAQPPHLLQQHTQPTTLQMWVPQDRVGAVIGSQGTVIKALQDQSRATIQVHNDTIRGDRKLFTIVGGPAECSLARQLVMEIIDRPRSGQHHAHNHSGSNMGSPPPSHQAVGNRDRNSYQHAQDQADGGNRLSKTVYVPTSCVGLVIGRRGETIRDLQQKSGATILVTKDRDAAQGSQERSVLISGTHQAITAAHMLVSQIVREAYVRRNAQGHGSNHSGGPPSALGPTLVETLTVPDDKVGLIIGKGGSAIRELQSLSGAKIQVAKEDEASSSNNTRPVTITGVRNCIETAKSLIADKVNMHLPSTPLQTFSSQQSAYPPTPGLYFPMYEPGFGHHMQGAYQHAPPQASYDPADQQAQMRASMAYYQYYGYAAAAHQQHMMQYHNHEQHRQHQHGQTLPHSQHAQTSADGQEQSDQDGQAEPQKLQGSSPEMGDAPAGPAQSESIVPSSHPQQQPPLSNHAHPQHSSFGMQDQRGIGPVSGQTQPLSHMTRQQMHVQQQQQQMQRVSHQMPQHLGPRSRILPQQHGHMQHGHMHPQVAQQARAHHAQIQAQFQVQAAHMHAHHFRVAQQAHAHAHAQQVQAQQAQSQPASKAQSGGQESTSRAPGATAVAQRELTQRGGNTASDDVHRK